MLGERMLIWYSQMKGTNLSFSRRGNSPVWRSASLEVGTISKIRRIR